MSLSTHVLDSTRGRPAAGIRVRLDDAEPLVTDDDGRVRDFGPVGKGAHRLVFDSGAYFHGETFYPEVVVTVQVDDSDQHHHVALLLSPFAYTTYRGS